MIRQLLFVALVGLALAAPSDKVNTQLRKVLEREARANVVVSFTQDTSAVLQNINNMRFASRTAKITTMKGELEALQTSTQKNAMSILAGHSGKVQSLWINNRIYIEDATIEVVTAIAALPEVAEVREQIVASIIDPIHDDQGAFDVEWNIAKIEADKAWELPEGNQGEGVVVAVIDTGVRGTHQTLSGSNVDAYGWFDPYDGSATPNDGNGHGTHVTGVIAGTGGIGVAPRAQWIACKGCSTISCSEAALTACGQFVVCPTRSDGGNPDCSKAAAAVSNSWGGGTAGSWFDSIIDSWQTAGVIPVFAQGNSGPTCGSANYPGNHPNVIGVGSTTNADVISGSSSRGPTADSRIKPDIVAPGQEIRSAWATSDTAFQTISGTSMATPHVTGTVALLKSHTPSLTFRQVKDLLQDNADRNLGAANTCGSIPPTTFPNNVYGHGRVNARRALEAAINA